MHRQLPIQRRRSIDSICNPYNLYGRPRCIHNSSGHDVELNFDVFMYQLLSGRRSYFTYEASYATHKSGPNMDCFLTHDVLDPCGFDRGT